MYQFGVRSFVCRQQLLSAGQYELHVKPVKEHPGAPRGTLGVHHRFDQSPGADSFEGSGVQAAVAAGDHSLAPRMAVLIMCIYN